MVFQFANSGGQLLLAACHDNDPSTAASERARDSSTDARTATSHHGDTVV